MVLFSFEKVLTTVGVQTVFSSDPQIPAVQDRGIDVSFDGCFESVDYASLQPSNSPFLASDKWRSRVHWNGITLFQENESNRATMACCNIAASPLDVFSQLVVRKEGQLRTRTFQDINVLEMRPDDMHCLVFKANLLQPSTGWPSIVVGLGLLSRREVVLEQVRVMPSQVFSKLN